MARKRPTKPVKIRGRGYYPKLPEAEQKTIALFLEWYQLIAMQAVEKANAARKRYPTEAVFQKQYEYWDNVVSGIKWLIYHVPNRQKYLEIQRCLTLDPNFIPTPEPEA